jgi:hypothetical protein
MSPPLLSEDTCSSSSQNRGISPSDTARYGLNGRKETRKPSITPRKFSRFFTPRSHGTFANSSTRRVLFDVTRRSNNRNGIQSSPIRHPSNMMGPGEENTTALFTREMKRRKIFHVPASPSDEDPSSGDAKAGRQSTPSTRAISEDGNIMSSPCGRSINQSSVQRYQRHESNAHPSGRRIERLEDRGVPGRLAQLSLGNLSSPRRRRAMHPVPGK